MEYVEYKGKKYEVKDGTLKLMELNIKNINKIKGLKNLSKLKVLYFTGNQIKNVKDLKSLNNLEALYLSGNQITEIEGLGALPNLKVLYLATNQIKDISKIKGLKTLKNIEVLCLRTNQITEINGLESLINLQKLDLESNKISEIKGLENLINLKKLNLRFNKITNIIGLKTLTNLQKLSLSGNQIAEINGLESLINLQKLELGSNKISEIKGLENLINLKFLYLHFNPIINEEYYLIDKSPTEVVDFCKKKKEQIYKFDFALSFASQDREIIEKIAIMLRDKGINVFYDNFYKADLLGKDLSNHFKEIYGGKKSKYVVIFISENYILKDWANFEFEIAKKAEKFRNVEYILPIRLDNTIIQGLKRSIGYIDYFKEGLDETVKILYNKLKKNNSKLTK